MAWPYLSAKLGIWAGCEGPRRLVNAAANVGTLGNIQVSWRARPGGKAFRGIKIQDLQKYQCTEWGQVKMPTYAAGQEAPVHWRED